MKIGKLEFCQAFVHLNGARIRFDGRPYLPQIYASRARRLVLKTSRQVEKSTLLANTLLYELVTTPGVKILFVAPRDEQASVFIQSRFQAMLEQSPVLRRILLGKSARATGVRHMRFRNGSELYVRAAFLSADSARGISADRLFIDEYQDLADGTLAVLQEVLSHSADGRTILVGTPKLTNNPLQTAYAQSTANEWVIGCPKCNSSVILDERCLGPTGIICCQCQTALDVGTGRWVPRQPDSTWGDGFWINHLMVPWLNYHEILDRQRTYDLCQFKNEALGLAASLGELVIMRAELEACCGEQSMAQSINDVPHAARRDMIAGIDWGGGRKSRTVVVIGYYRRDNKFIVVHVKSFRADEDPKRLISNVAELCRRFHVRWIGADGRGNGLTINRLLLDELKYRSDLYGIVYSEQDHKPVQDGTVWMWTVNRTTSIALFYNLVRKGFVEFPRVSECGWYLDELCCELAEFDDKKRRIRYTKPDNLRDDALHASTYAMLIMHRWLDSVSRQPEIY
jgi:phage terminase large subunit GpA